MAERNHNQPPTPASSEQDDAMHATVAWLTRQEEVTAGPYIVAGLAHQRVAFLAYLAAQDRPLDPQ